jgi:hypothetical protein
MSTEAVPTVRPRAQSLNDVRAVIRRRVLPEIDGSRHRCVLGASLLYLLPVAGLALIDVWWAVVVMCCWPGWASPACSCWAMTHRTAPWSTRAEPTG